MNKIELVEQFKIVLLNSNNCCLGVSAISMGGISSCIVDKRIIFATALKANAVGLILAHNHPSGNLNPSKIDIDLTAQIAECGKLFEINVLDHIIVTKNGFSSMADNALMP
ncbi:MAG: JAB domain-containing protein [Sphingobacteriales bacterium JAD_PAG50586_3]|nr:MAG: JAB domain-containing protein [Sphingobacteriales bacterium JAD_PAG50586_3]